MEDMLENKAKFFAQYHGQYVFRCHNYMNGGYIMYSGRALKNGYLELTSIHSITDQDRTVLEESIIGFITEIYFVGYFGYLKINTSLSSDPSDIPMNPFHVDYLRQKGYALPWNRMSVEEQISLGWIKLST